MQHVISSDTIISVSANEDVYTRGENYYREGKIVAFHAKRQDTETVVKASVKGNFRNYDVNLHFDSKGEITEYNCSCAGKSIWQGACKHIVAVLFAISDGRTSTDKKRQDQESFTDTLEKIILQEIDETLDIPVKAESGRLAKLCPRFHFKGEGEAYLTFYVGYSRMYTVKSLSKFLQAVAKGNTVRYGNGLEFNHSKANFNVSGRKWIDFLVQEDELYNEMIKNRHHVYANGEDNREIRLTRRNMDIFFEICKDVGVEIGTDLFSQGEDEAYLRLSTNLPNIHFDIINSQDELILRGPRLRYAMLKGHKYYYIMEGGTLYQMAKAEAKLLNRIFGALNRVHTKDDNVRGQIALNGYAHHRFVSVVMPKLISMGLIDGNLCPDLCAKIYFDEEDYDIFCRIVFCYDEINKYDAFDHREGDGPRDIAGEYTVKRMLLGQGFQAEPENRIFRLTSDDNIFAFIGDSPAGIEKLTANPKCDIYISDSLKRRTVRAGKGSIGVRRKGRSLDIYVKDTDFTLNELVEALESFRAKKRYHHLKDGRFLSLTDKATQAMADTLVALDVEPKDLNGGAVMLPLYRAPYVDSIIKDQNASFKKLIRQFYSNEGCDIPKSLEKVLRPYQKIGCKWLSNLLKSGFGAILADDMGLGKTLQVLAVLLTADLKTYPALVVAPTSLIYNWAQEIRKFAPELTAEVVAGPPEKRKALLETKGVKVFITTYDAMKRDAEEYEDKRYKYLIADEAQNIKNPGTKNARTIKLINADHRIALTGTPIENTLTELWSLFDFIMPGYLHSPGKFTKLYEIPVTTGDKESINRLKEQIAPFILRRVKSNVLSELPPKTETTLMAEMLPEQRKIYTAYAMEAKGKLKELISAGSLKGNRIQILAQLTRLRQICCHPGLCTENYNGGSGKLDLAMETIEIAIQSGHRCLLFSQFTEMLAILRENIEKSGNSYFYLDGATPAKDRMDRVDRFNAGEGDIFLISLKAGGTGLNLTGADIVIHYDPWWNPSVMDQASDRAYRIGQNKAVQVFNLVAMQTLEEGIMELQERKRKLINSVLSEDINVTSLSDKEIEELLDIYN